MTLSPTLEHRDEGEVLVGRAIDVVRSPVAVVHAVRRAALAKHAQAQRQKRRKKQVGSESRRHCVHAAAREDLLCDWNQALSACP